MAAGPVREMAIEALFDPLTVRAFVATTNPALLDQLDAGQRAETEHMAHARQVEFATARACAQAAVCDFGITAVIPRRDDGAPRWPTGIAGSISHSRGYCVAVAGGGDFSLGVDVEEVDRLSPAIERRVLVDQERDDVESLTAGDRQAHVATVFAAKEAFYKAYHEIVPRYLGFDAVRVNVDRNRVSYEAASTAVDPAIVARCSGRCRHGEGRVTVGVAIDTVGIARPLTSHL